MYRYDVYPSRAALVAAIEKRHVGRKVDFMEINDDSQLLAIGPPNWGDGMRRKIMVLCYEDRDVALRMERNHSDREEWILWPVRGLAYDVDGGRIGMGRAYYLEKG
jgi:hypothetical protein